MRAKYGLQVFVAGMAIFSMFFGGGNLTFPLWIGSETSSVFLASLGFIVSGVLLPFFGIAITLMFNGDYEKCFETFGKTFGKILIFTLLLFWIPLGSGPRCHQLAYGAFCSQIDWKIPMWLYSAFYSVLVYAFTVSKKRVLDILGKVITPLLIFSLFFIIISAFVSFGSEFANVENLNWNDLYPAFVAGYNTMDFIAAIFFASTVIALVKEKQQEKFNIRFVAHSCLFAIVLLSIVYVGMISVGYVYEEILSTASKDQLLAVIGRSLFNEHAQFIIFIVITLSVLSTSMALTLVFSEYLRKTIFKEKVDSKICLLISIGVSFLMSIIGFEKLAVLISHGMSVLYPLLLLVTLVAFIKKTSFGKKLLKDKI